MLFEMLDQIERQPNFQTKAATMAYLKCYELSSILQINFRPDVRLELPPGPIAFQKDNGDPDMSLKRTRNVISDFKDLDVRNRSLGIAEKIRRFVGMLESVNEREAEVFLLAKDKKLQTKWKSLSIELIRAAIPGIV